MHMSNNGIPAWDSTANYFTDLLTDRAIGILLFPLLSFLCLLISIVNQIQWLCWTQAKFSRVTRNTTTF